MKIRPAILGIVTLTLAFAPSYTQQSKEVTAQPVGMKVPVAKVGSKQLKPMEMPLQGFKVDSKRQLATKPVCPAEAPYYGCDNECHYMPIRCT